MPNNTLVIQAVARIKKPIKSTVRLKRSIPPLPLRLIAKFVRSTCPSGACSESFALTLIQESEFDPAFITEMNFNLYEVL